MRAGWNPLKRQGGIAPPAQVTAAVVNCIPEEEGYYAEALDVLRLCLASLRSHAEGDLDILVVDNASCDHVRDFLVSELRTGGIQYLQLNGRNIGVGNAMLQSFRIAPGQLVLYSDGDIYYRPGWLRAHLDVARTYPDIGMVAGIPQRALVDYHTGPTQAFASSTEGVQVEEGDLMRPEWIEELLTSIGLRSGSAVHGAQDRIAKMMAKRDIRLTYQGQTAYVGAGHMQFLIPRAAIDQLPRQWTDLATSCKEALLDEPLAKAGLLRLTTDRPVAYHMGNSIQEPWLKEELARLTGRDSASARQDTHKAISQRIWQQPHVRRTMRAIYSWAFRRYLAGAGED